MLSIQLLDTWTIYSIQIIFTFEHMVHRIYPAELQLNKVNASDTAAAFLDLNLSIHNDIVSAKIYDKREKYHVSLKKKTYATRYV